MITQNITHILDQDQLLHTTMEPVAGVEEVVVAEVGVEEADVEEVVGVDEGQVVPWQGAGLSHLPAE